MHLLIEKDPMNRIAKEVATVEEAEELASRFTVAVVEGEVATPFAEWKANQAEPKAAMKAKRKR
jgi:hypothetical protein